jgi:hypothetical protein
MTIQDFFNKLKKDKVQFTGIHAIRVPATANKSSFFVTEVRSSGMVKVEVDSGTRGDGSFMPFAILSEKAKDIITSRLNALIK